MSMIACGLRFRRHTASDLLMLFVMMLVVAASETVPLQQAGTLQSYTGLERSDGLATKALVRVDADKLKAARTIRILPTAFAPSARRDDAALTERQWVLVGNAINRSLCVGLSERFTLADRSGPADLTVRVLVTGLGTTNEVAAGISKGIMIVPSFLQVPVPAPRIPIGLGSLTAEVEARDTVGGQAAVMVWARQAQILGSSPTVSKIGDAYALADELGQDASRLLVDGTSPFGRLPAIPSKERVGATLGFEAEQPACRAFGSGPGLGGTVGSIVGLPPEWIDDDAAPGS